MSTYYAIQLLPGQNVSTPVVANAAVTELLRGRLGWDGLLICDCDAILEQVSACRASSHGV
jgi:beta-glucosidase-like glycosyl hydrolase